MKLLLFFENRAYSEPHLGKKTPMTNHYVYKGESTENKAICKEMVRIPAPEP